MLLLDLGRLRPETEDQRDAGAIVGEADISELRARLSELRATGMLLDEQGEVRKFSAFDAREMMEAKSARNL